MTRRIVSCRCASPDHHGDESETGFPVKYYAVAYDPQTRRTAVLSPPLRFHRAAQRWLAENVHIYRARFGSYYAEPWIEYGTVGVFHDA